MGTGASPVQAERSSARSAPAQFSLSSCIYRHYLAGFTKKLYHVQGRQGVASLCHNSKRRRACVTTPSAQRKRNARSLEESGTRDRSCREAAKHESPARQCRETSWKKWSPRGTALRLAARQSASLFPLPASEQALIYGSAACTLRCVADPERYRRARSPRTRHVARLGPLCPRHHVRLPGVAHFNKIRHDLARMVPSSFPQPMLIVHITGVCEFLGAAGLLIPRFRSLAGICLTLLLIGMFAANVNAALKGMTLAGKPVTPLWLRTRCKSCSSA